MGLDFYAVDGFNIADDALAASVKQLEGDLIKMSISFHFLWGVTMTGNGQNIKNGPRSHTTAGLTPLI